MKEAYEEYFEYYLELEKEFFSTESYVAIEKANYKTYSVHYNRLYQSICSEIDCILKEICKQIDSKSKASKITRYYSIIINNMDKLKQETVYFNKQRIEIKPWKNWTKDKSPTWWTYYNKVKHHRMEIEEETNKQYYKYANLENVLNALAGLYILEQYFIFIYKYHNIDVIDKNIILKDEIKKRKKRALLENISTRCSMKRWLKAGCYSEFMGVNFFDIEKLVSIM